jgi:hypothetical protein
MLHCVLGYTLLSVQYGIFQGSFVCACDVGFYGNGESACDDTDECSSNTHDCDAASSSCQNTVGSFSCTCFDGYAVDTANSCKNVDECALSLHACGPFAVCSDSVGSYTCTCEDPGRPNLAPDLRNCTDRNECAANASNCHPMALCNSKSRGIAQRKPGAYPSGLCNHAGQCVQCLKNVQLCMATVLHGRLPTDCIRLMGNGCLLAL